jgi:hypothetical protein
MHAFPGKHTRFDRWSSLLACGLVATAGLLLAACQGDAPTGVAGGAATTAPTAFTLVPGASRAVATSTQRLVRTMPTVQLVDPPEAGPAGVSTRTVNSPFDLTFNGGPVVTSATSRNVYVNCAAGPAACWGTGTLTPATYLEDLNHSNLIEVADQYLRENAAGQFRLTELQTTATFTGNTASLDDVFEIIFSASRFLNASGYHNIFHVFLPKGTDMCMTPTSCYSPDNPSTFTFCAFHGSVNFGPDQHVLFTVQPYQAVPGCQLLNQTRVIDATASTLSHEFFEAITDPDLDAWFNDLTGNEVSDLCFTFRNNEQVGRHAYVVQEEYSNTIHLCTDGAR